MKSKNYVELIGTLKEQPILRKTALNNKDFSVFTIIIEANYQGKTTYEYVGCQGWGDYTNFMKGEEVALNGRLRSWSNEVNGVKTYGMRVVVDKMNSTFKPEPAHDAPLPNIEVDQPTINTTEDDILWD